MELFAVAQFDEKSQNYVRSEMSSSTSYTTSTKEFVRHLIWVIFLWSRKFSRFMIYEMAMAKLFVRTSHVNVSTGVINRT